MRHLLLNRFVIGLTALVVVASLVLATSARAAPREIPVAGQSAFCNGEPVAAVNGVLHLHSGCVLNMHIVWLPGMKSAYAEFSSDNGSTWSRDPLAFPVAAVGAVSGHALLACDARLSTGRYLLRAHGFKSPTEHGDLFSAVFANSISVTCS
jgi:hypothetical protein